jgi:hypothetical protein
MPSLFRRHVAQGMHMLHAFDRLHGVSSRLQQLDHASYSCSVDSDGKPLVW